MVVKDNVPLLENPSDSFLNNILHREQSYNWKQDTFNGRDRYIIQVHLMSPQPTKWNLNSASFHPNFRASISDIFL
jgi:hypothetical protein